MPQIFLGLRKVYNSQDMWICLNITWMSGLGPRITGIIELNWKYQKLCPMRGGGLGRYLQLHMGSHKEIKFYL